MIRSRLCTAVLALCVVSCSDKQPTEVGVASVAGTYTLRTAHGQVPPVVVLQGTLGPSIHLEIMDGWSVASLPETRSHSPGSTSGFRRP
jgi:hypothetical protein